MVNSKKSVLINKSKTNNKGVALLNQNYGTLTFGKDDERKYTD